MSAVTPFDWWTKNRGTAFEGRRVQVLYDYDVRTDSQPVYVGMSLAGALEADEAWFISNFTYDGSGRIISWFTSNNNVRWTTRAAGPYNAKG